MARRWLILALLALPLVGGGVWAAAGLELDASARVLLAADARNRESKERLDEAFDGRTVVTLLLRRADWFDDEGAALLHDLGDALLARDAVAEVKSLSHARRPVRRGFSLDPTEMFTRRPFVPRDPRPPAVWDTLRREVTASPLARGVFISADARWAQVVVEAAAPPQTHAERVAFQQLLLDAVAPHREALDEVHLMGFPLIEVEMQEAVATSLLRVVIVGGALALVWLLLAFRSPALVAALVVAQLVGASALVLVLSWLEVALDLYTATLVPLLLALQLTWFTHLASAWQGARAAGQGPLAALGRATDEVLFPALAATVTTALGLLSLVSSDLEVVRRFGALGAAGALVLFGVGLLPWWWLARGAGQDTRQDAAQDAAQDTGGRPGAATGPGLAATWLGALTGRRAVVLFGAGVIALVCLPGLTGLRADVRAVEYLDPEGSSRRALAVLDEHMGGMNWFALEIDTGRAGGVHELSFLRWLDGTATALGARDDVGGVFAYTQVFRVLNQLWEEDAPGSFALPENPLMIGLFATALRAGRFPLLDTVVNTEARTTRLVVRTRDMPSGRYLALLETVRAAVSEGLPEGVTVRDEQGLATVLEGDRRLVASQMRSLGVSLVTIALALAVLLRSVRLALAVVATQALPLLLLLGAFGALDLPLNSITVLAGAVVLGVAVDDAIHFLAVYRRLTARLAPREALTAALAQKARPMLATTAILVTGCLLLGLAAFPPVAHFGLGSGLALSAALAVTLTVLPLLVLGGAQSSHSTPRRSG